MTDAVDDILNSLDMDQLAAQVGADPAEVERAVTAALPALFGGLNANAQDQAGAQSILQALPQHDPSLLEGGVDINDVDASDGEAIAQHIFGGNTDEVYNQLGAYGAAGGLGGSLFRRLLPILAPIVLSYIMKQMTQRTGGSSGSSGGGGLGGILDQILGGGSSAQPNSAPADEIIPTEPAKPTTTGRTAEPTSSGGQLDLDGILKDVLGGAASSTGSRTQTQSGSAGGGSILDVLGSILGGGRR